jgi:hypothetical protein
MLTKPLIQYKNIVSAQLFNIVLGLFNQSHVVTSSYRDKSYELKRAQLPITFF